MTMRFGRTVIQPSLVLLVLLAAAPGPSTAAELPTQADEDHSRLGGSLMDEGRFEEAISEYRKAYELEAKPQFLFHIGRAYDRLGQSTTALHFFRRYLAASPPPSPERDEAELAVANAPPPPPTEPLPSNEPMQPSLGLYNTDAADPSSSVLERWWFWAAVSAVAIAGISLGFLAFRGDNDTLPPSDLGHKRLN